LGGELGDEAFSFVDFLHETGQSLWQMLPVGPTHGDLSPYQALSSHAGNPVFVSLTPLQEAGFLHTIGHPGAYEDVLQFKRRCIASAWTAVTQQLNNEWMDAFDTFCDGQTWLHDYALFIALRNQHGHQSWTDWPEPFRSRDQQALKSFYQQHQQIVDAIKFEQYLFFTQWQKLRDYASKKNVQLLGDLPIFVAHDSAEVWCRPELFLLDEQGKPTEVAGVPPDYFSETGQRWGNPLYNWQEIQKQSFQWWIERIETQLQLFDKVRIDHFRGFEAFWAIPATEETAINGQWRKAPGEELFTALQQHFSMPLPLIAEDLGIITPEVDALRKRFKLPGMKILQFAFGGQPDNPYLPHNHEKNAVVYTGTHDNNTTLGWYKSLPENEKRHVHEYLFQSEEPINWLLIKAAAASVANTCILPLQDVMGLDGLHRMNTPGTTEGNWRWRFDWSQLGAKEKTKLKTLTQVYGRLRMFPL